MQLDQAMQFFNVSERVIGRQPNDMIETKSDSTLIVAIQYVVLVPAEYGNTISGYERCDRVVLRQATSRNHRARRKVQRCQSPKHMVEKRLANDVSKNLAG